MSKIRGKHTQPELLLRRWLFAKGYRYRLHAQTLPGSPDIVFGSRRMAIFVHGCFWHGHANCKRATRPKSNAAFWAAKIRRNIERDKKAARALRADGWRILTVWQCQLKNENRLEQRLLQFLGNAK